MSSMNPADQSFAVHLESLLGFAQELTTQVHGITKPSGELEALLSTPVLLGAFNEANSLGATHAAAVAEMHVLLADVQEALAFANDVTKTVADGYSKLDSDLAAYLGAHGALGSTGDTSGAGTTTTTSTAPAGIDAGPVTVGARTDGQTGLQLNIDGTTVTAGLDGVHIETGDPGTGSTTGISVPLGASQPSVPAVPPVTGV